MLADLIEAPPDMHGHLERLDGPEVTLALADDRLHARVGEAEAMGLLVAGEFPPWRDVMPAPDHGTPVGVDREAFAAAWARATAISSGRETLALVLTFGDGVLEMASRDPMSGDATVEHPIDWHAKGVEVGVNPALVADALRASDAARLTLRVKDGKSPVVLSEDGGDLVYVVMPIQIV